MCVRSVMNAYQELDGLPAGRSRSLLQDLLRDELGFDGVVLSDYFTLNMFIEYHHLTEDKREAAHLGILPAGLTSYINPLDLAGLKSLANWGMAMSAPRCSWTKPNTAIPCSRLACGWAQITWSQLQR